MAGQGNRLAVLVIQGPMHARALRWFLAIVLLLLPTLLDALANVAQPLVWQGAIEIAKGRGERGPWQQNESRYDFVDDPSVAINARGEIAVVWVDQAAKAVLFQRFSPDGKKQLDRPTNVSRLPRTFSWLPRVAIAPDAPDAVFVLWQEIIFSGGSHGGDILFARSIDGGRSFSQPVNLSRSQGGDGKGRINREIWHNGSLDLVAGPDGALYAAWTEYEGALWLSRSGDGGRSFSPAQRIAAEGARHPARAPSLALGPDRTLYLAWTTGEDEGADIHLARSTDGGASFGRPERVAPSSNYSDAPKLAVGPGGVLHLAYAESSGGPFAHHQVRYTRSADGGRSFEIPREISSPMPGSFAGAAFPALSVDAQGRVYVSWELYAAERQGPRGLGLAVSSDGGRSFGSPSLVPDSMDPAGGLNGSSQGLLMKKLAVSASGAVAIVNSSLKQGSRSRVWLMRGALPR
jgi:hypothetical protein